MAERKIIQVKPSYIHTDFMLRFTIGFAVFFVFFTLLSILRLSFFENSYFYLELALSIVLSGVGMGFILSSERILRKLAKKWDYKKFCRLEVSLGYAFAISSVSLPSLLLMIWLAPILKTDLLYVLSGALLIFLFAIPFRNFYTQEGGAILYYSDFIEDFKTNTESADFSQVLLASLAVGKVARKENMEINPYCLGTGLSVGFLQDKKTTIDDVTKLIEWIENPRKDGNFASFKNAVRTYTKLSKTLSKEGINEIQRWSFEQKLAIYLIAVPSAVGILTAIIPELIKIVPF